MSLVRTSIAGFITAGELIDSITPATVSAEDRGYRRGFSHGYAQAMDDMLLTINRGYSRPREAWNILAAHHDQALLPWRQRKGAAAEPYSPPPRFQQPRRWVDIRQEALERDGNACVLCGSTEALEVDHIHPVFRGGRPDMENLRVLCVVCHRARRRRSRV